MASCDGTLERYKTRWVLWGFTQRPGVDYDETFSPVVKPATVRMVFSLVLSRSWPVHQLDVKNAFLHSTLSETVYCSQPARFVDSSRPNMVCRLNKSLYDLKQAPRAWYSRFATFLLTLGFTEAKADTSLSSTAVGMRLPTCCSMLMTLCSPPPVSSCLSVSSPLCSRSLL